MRKGTSGTHYKSKKNLKTRSFTVRLSEDDFQMIRQKAEILGISIGEFIVGACAGKRVPGYRKPEPEPNQDIPGQMNIMDYIDNDPCEGGE